MGTIDNFKKFISNRLLIRKDNHLLKSELDNIVDLIEMFADDNNMNSEVIWDNDKLREINYYTKYDSRSEYIESIDNNSDINFTLFSNNLEFIEIINKHKNMDLEDRYPEGNRLMDKMYKLVNRIKKMYPNLKYSFPSGPNIWHLRIEK